MEPARSIIAKFGGVKAVSELTGVHRTRVHGWMSAKDKGGTGGTIPLKHIGLLLAESEKRSLGITADSFIPTFAAPELEQA